MGDVSFPEWQLLPPRRGAEIDIFGFPSAKITVEAGVHMQDIEPRSETVKVAKVFDVLQAHGFTGFPGFQVDRDLAHGFSGGPAFYDGRFIGIFSGPNYVSSLWPLLIHEYPHRDDNRDIDIRNSGTVTQPMTTRPFADLFDTGAIKALDYEDVKGHIHRVSCHEALAMSEIDTRCDKRHVILTR